MVYIFLADGFEDVEAIAPYDILVRGGVETEFCSIYDDRFEVTAAHGTKVTCTSKIKDAGEADILVMPGGLPGAYNLRDCPLVKEKIMKQYESGKLVAAICAAPTVLGGWGILADKKATCYPSCSGDLHAKEYCPVKVIKDKNVITGQAPGAAYEIGFELLKVLKGEKVTEEVKSGMCV